MPYLIGPNSDPITPNPNSAMYRMTSECVTKPATAIAGDRDLDHLQPLRDHRLVEAVGNLAAERRQKEIGRDEDRAGQRDQRVAMRTVDLAGSGMDAKQDQKDNRVLQQIIVERREELAPE